MILTLALFLSLTPQAWPSSERGTTTWSGSHYYCEPAGALCAVPSPAETAAHAQSIPATYPDRMDAKPVVMPACKRVGFHRDSPAEDCYIQTNDGCNTTTWTDTGFGVYGISTAMACSHSSDLMFPLVTPAAIPPAKHHSAAPQPHKSHARRKVRK